MLNFINSFVLPFLAAALIPLLLHLLSRQKQKIIPFSSLRFLKELQNKRLRHIKLYQFLIILIRMLFIVFLVLAFSRPTLKNLLGYSGGTRTTAVIVIDNSYSMQRLVGLQSSYDKARQVLATILKTFDPKDHVVVLTPKGLHGVQEAEFSPQNRPDFTRWHASNLSPAFQAVILRAARIFGQFPNYNRELYFLTDNQISRQALGDSALRVLRKLPVRFYLVPLAGTDFNNLCLDTAFVQSRLFEPQKPVQVSCRVLNQAQAPKQAIINLFAASSRLAMTHIELPAQSKREATLRFVPRHPGFYALKLETEDDDLLPDNQYFLSLFIPEKISVLYVQNNTPLELKEALSTLSDQTNLAIRQTDYAHWYGEVLPNYQTLILNDPPQITQAFLVHLKQFLDAGKSLVLIPGTSLSPAEYNRLTDFLLGKKLFIDLVKAAPPRFFSLKTTAEGSRLLTDIFTSKQTKIEWPKVFQYFRLRSCPHTLLSVGEGDPFLCRQSSEKRGQLWLFAGNFSGRWGNFPLNGLFLPLLHQIFSLAANQKPSATNFVVGKTVTLYLSEAQLSAHYRLKEPNGESLTVVPRQTPRGLRFTFEGLTDPGIYTILKNDQPAFLFAMNLSSDEWAEPLVPLQKIRKDAVILKPEDISVQNLKKERLGLELWPYFLALALLMLLIEMFLIRKLEGTPFFKNKLTPKTE
jgi:hypothetical protein